MNTRSSIGFSTIRIMGHEINGIIRSFLLFCLLGFNFTLGAKENYEETYNMVRAREESDKGNYNEAKEFLEKELKQHPDNGYAYIYLAILEYGDHRYDEVFPKIEKALKYIPKKDKERLSLVYSLRGEMYLTIGDTASSIKDYSKSIELNPYDYLPFENLGQIYFEQGKYDESDENYHKLIELNPGKVNGYMGLGRNEYNRGNYDGAIKEYNKVIGMFPEYSSGYSFRADAALQQGKYVDAANDIMRALEIDWDGKAHYLLSQFPEDQTSLILAKLRGMAVKYPHDATWQFCIAQTYSSKREYDNAIEELKKAYETDAHPVFLEMLADCYQGLGDFESALNYVDKALDINPDNLDLIGTKADIRGEAGDIEGAVEVWTDYINRLPDYFGGYYRRGWFKDLSMKTDEAIEDYTMAITLNPDYAYAHLGLADMYQRKGETEKALEEYGKVIELDTIPNDNSCAMYALLALGRKDEALEFLNKVIELDTLDAGSYYDAACIYGRIGEKEKSLQNLKIALEKGFRRFHHIENDDDLDLIRDMPEFDALMKKYGSTGNNINMKFNDSESVEKSVIKEEGSTVEIPFTSDGGCATVKCAINDLPLTFIFDTGASIVSMSQLEANFMLKNGYLKPSDFIGTGNFIDANGDISEGSVINLRNVEFGGMNLTNVKASVVKNQKAPLLLGQSVLGRLGSIEIDNANKKLIIKNNIVKKNI